MYYTVGRHVSAARCCWILFGRPAFQGQGMMNGDDRLTRVSSQANLISGGRFRNNNNDNIRVIIIAVMVIIIGRRWRAIYSKLRRTARANVCTRHTRRTKRPNGGSPFLSGNGQNTCYLTAIGGYWLVTIFCFFDTIFTCTRGRNATFPKNFLNLNNFFF